MKLKALSLITAVLMTASCFAACNNTQAPSDSQTSDKDSSSEESNTSDEGAAKKHQQIEVSTTPVEDLDATKTSLDTSEPVNLLWYQWGDAAADSDMVYKELNKRSKEAINTTVYYKFADGTKAGLIVSTDEYYDMIFCCSWHVDYVKNANQGVYAELEDILPTVAPTLYNFIPEVVWDGATVNDHICLVPIFKDSAGTQMWAMDKSLLKEAGVTEEELSALNEDKDSITPILEKIKNNTDMEGAEAPFMIAGGASLNHQFDYITYAGAGIGVPFDAKDTKVVSVLETDEALHNAEVYSKWYKKGLINQDAATIDVAPWSPAYVRQGWPDCEAIWYNPDHGDIDVRVHVPTMYTTDYIIGSGHAISVNSNYIERALLYLQWINCDYEARNIFAYGIEGTHWNLTDEGTVEKTERGMSKYRPDSWAQATFFTTIPESPKPRDSWDSLYKTCMTATPSPLLGFTADTTNVETEMAATGTIWSQYSKNLACGMSEDPAADLAVAIEALNNAGLQTIIDEFQEQVDKFMAAK